MGDKHAHQQEVVHVKEQEGNSPTETKPTPEPVLKPGQSPLLDNQTPIAQFVPEPYGETATGSVVSGTVVAEFVDNPSDMAHEYAIVRVDLGANRYVRLGGPFIVEKKR